MYEILFIYKEKLNHELGRKNRQTQKDHITSSEVTQTWKERYHMFSLI